MPASRRGAPPPARPCPGVPPLRTLPLLVAALLVVAGCGARPPVATGFGAGDPPVSVVAAATAAAVAAPPAGVAAAADRPPPPGPDAAPVRVVSWLPPSRPLAVAIPAIGVDAAPVLGLALDAGGVLEMPDDPAVAGWFTGGPPPGTVGVAVLTGHRAAAAGPGLFARLPELAPGAEVQVLRSDGAEAVFSVYRVERYPRAGFPAQRVHGATAGAELRLVTAGGVYDRGTGPYPDNVVAYARLVGVR